MAVPGLALVSMEILIINFVRECKNPSCKVIVSCDFFRQEISLSYQVNFEASPRLRKR